MIKEIEFNRPAKYTLVEELGSGACGATVLLRDEGMGTDLVAKKSKKVRMMLFMLSFLTDLGMKLGYSFV